MERVAISHYLQRAAPWLKALRPCGENSEVHSGAFALNTGLAIRRERIHLRYTGGKAVVLPHANVGGTTKHKSGFVP